LVGQKTTVRDLVALLERERPFYDESGGGVTFSGGEPLMQGDFLLACLEALRDRNIHTAVDTCGFADMELILEVARCTDLFLYDLKIMDDPAHRQHTGANFGSILKNLQALDAAGAAVWIRVPIIPGVNDDHENISAIGRFVAALEGRHPLYLLPYHKLGADKYRRRHTPYALEHAQPPSLQHVERLGAILVDMGLEIYIKGANES
jgi:pyruvate formate lyase activating enzyme